MAYTTETFIEKVTKIHTGKYDYSKVEYNGATKKVIIICPIHGEFNQTPMLHIQGCGCPKCGIIKSSEANKQTKEEWITKAKEMHCDKYDYSKVEYNGYNQKVCIICPIHGEFWQNPTNHIAKHQHRGCPKCGEILSKTTDEFIKEALLLYGDKFDYSKVDYVNSHTKVCIICPTHGDLWVYPYDFLKKGCVKCNQEKKLDNETIIFIKEATEKYNRKYDYSKVNYNGKTKEVLIVCPEHGEFKQTPSQHINGVGCYECWKNETFWSYEKCYNIAKQYKYKIDFKINDKNAYSKSVEEKWIENFDWLIERNISSDDRTIYVYEFSDGAAYVGLTNWLEHRDFQHRWEKGNSSVYEYSISNNIEIPLVKILEENVNVNKAGNVENKWIKFYRDNGWKIINKVKGGALGAICGRKYTKENVIEETKKYKNQQELYKNNRTLYNAMIRYRMVKECFPKTNFKPKVSEHYNYTDEFLKEITEKYPKKSDLRKNEYRVYHWLYNHNRLYDFYTKG